MSRLPRPDTTSKLDNGYTLSEYAKKFVKVLQSLVEQELKEVESASKDISWFLLGGEWWTKLWFFQARKHDPRHLRQRKLGSLGRRANEEWQAEAKLKAADWRAWCLSEADCAPSSVFEWVVGKSQVAEKEDGRLCQSFIDEHFKRVEGWVNVWTKHRQLEETQALSLPRASLEELDAAASGHVFVQSRGWGRLESRVLEVSASSTQRETGCVAQRSRAGGRVSFVLGVHRCAVAETAGRKTNSASPGATQMLE